MLDTPRTVFKPNSVLTLLTALSVSTTPSCSADAVSVRQSINTSSLGIPIEMALSNILFAISNLLSALLGIPFSSNVRPTTAAPYFLTKGNTVFNDFSSPLTELTIGLPLYTLSAASNTSGMVESICKGVSAILWIDLIALIIISFSSTPGRPTFTSKISAPA